MFGSQVYKVADETAWLCKGQRFAKFFKGSLFLALTLEDQCLQRQQIDAYRFAV